MVLEHCLACRHLTHLSNERTRGVVRGGRVVQLIARPGSTGTASSAVINPSTSWRFLDGPDQAGIGSRSRSGHDALCGLPDRSQRLMPDDTGSPTDRSRPK